MVFNPDIQQSKDSVTRTAGNVSTKNVKTVKYSINQVEGIATAAFQQALGRKPTDAELNQFLASLNAYAKAHPEVTTGTDYTGLTTKEKYKSLSTKLKDVGSYTTGSKTSTGTTSGGVDVSNYATQFAQGLQGYGNYQKSTTYFDAMLSALSGPVGGSV